MKVVLDDGAYLPERAHQTDAGLDLRTPKAFTLTWGESYVIDTGVHIELPPGYYGKIESKSGLNTKHGIVCCGGVIDEGYQGSIAVVLYNLSKKTYLFEKGDKICQLIIQPYVTPLLEEVDQFVNKTERGNDGFGSTGK